jgi:MarR family transcriptional regulator, temperature-dependent positive regulator of motility
MNTMTTPGAMVLLTRLSRVVYRAATEKLLGIRLKQYMALNYLRDQGPTPQQELGEALHLDPNNLVLLLNDLEEDSYVERRRDTSDRRRHIVEITRAGGRALEHAERALESVEDEVLGALNAEERATLRRLLAQAMEGMTGSVREPAVAATKRRST